MSAPDLTKLRFSTLRLFAPDGALVLTAFIPAAGGFWWQGNGTFLGPIARIEIVPEYKDDQDKGPG